ncbi:MAG: hypothetical protein KJO18_03730 [Acidimicrobiia bacterium]|nr:hypothetical protein [Acidimicrobiia bacterium]
MEYVLEWRRSKRASVQMACVRVELFEYIRQHRMWPTGWLDLNCKDFSLVSLNWDVAFEDVLRYIEQRPGTYGSGTWTPQPDQPKLVELRDPGVFVKSDEELWNHLLLDDIAVIMGLPPPDD